MINLHLWTDNLILLKYIFENGVARHKSPLKYNPYEDKYYIYLFGLSFAFYI
jgi:hypothetical protein